MLSSTLFVGIHGNVIALDPATGKELWTVSLKGGDFVNVALDGNRVLAATKGEVYCLDASSGQIVWHNSLPGQGHGIVSMAVAGQSSSPVAIAAEKKRQEDEAAASTSVIAAT